MNLVMKKTAVLAILLALAAGTSFAEIGIEIGALAGTRSVNSDAIREVYGTGMIYYPFAAVHPWKGLFFGAGYEGAAARSGAIGIYEEATTLKLTGFEFFAGYEIPIGRIVPYVKAGYAVYSYRQSIDSPYIEENQVSASKSTFSLGAGLKAFMSDSFFLAAEFRVVPLKVTPFSDEVDLGGARYAAGIGLRF